MRRVISARISYELQVLTETSGRPSCLLRVHPYDSRFYSKSFVSRNVVLRAPAQAARPTGAPTSKGLLERWRFLVGGSPFGYIKQLTVQSAKVTSDRISTAWGQSVRSTRDPRSGFAVTILQRQARHISLQFGYNDQSVYSRKHQRRVHAARSWAV